MFVGKSILSDLRRFIHQIYSSGKYTYPIFIGKSILTYFYMNMIIKFLKVNVFIWV